MSDKNKLEKLAAAKKRLKQFQAQSQGPAASSPAPAEPTPSSSASDDSSIVATAAAVPPESHHPTDNGHNTIATPPIGSAAAVADDVIAIQLALAASQADAHQERQHNEALRTQIQQLHTHVQQLTTTSQSTNNATQNNAAAEAQIAGLQQQLSAHAQTIAVLVDEKSTLAASLGKFQSLAREKITEVEELQGRLNASRHRVQTLERELSGAREAAQKVDQTVQSVCTELEAANEMVRVEQRRIAELQDDAAELRQQLAVRKDECAEGQRQLQHAQYELGVAQLRVAQLSADGGEDGGAGDAKGDGEMAQLLREQADSQRQQIEELQSTLQRLTAEHEQSGEQYQTYVQQLTADNGRLAQQLHEYAEQNGRLAAREQQLVQHMGELERQMQQQMARQAKIASVDEAQVVTSSAELEGKTAQVQDAQIAILSEANAQQALEITQLREQVTMHSENSARLETELERMQVEQPDAKSLHDTMQGDKVTASRAVSQNVQLKQQLEELQKAFVQLSNDKLDLTERLQSEQYLGRENKHNADQRLEEVTSVREKLHFKDEEMIRLSHENEERTKEVLQLTQEIDRLRHYESKAQSNAIVQQQANTTISRLQNQIKELKLNESPADSQPPTDTANVLLNGESESLPDAIETGADAEADADIDALPIVETAHIPTEEAMEKLQGRFTRTMSDIADLTEEKNRLEHLVMQLQGETETIGEYIALYQSQRQQLKQREHEKDVQMQTIIHDREEMRQKLGQLNALVERLIVAQQQQNSNSPSAAPSENGEPPLSSSIEGVALSAPRSESTAEQILHLLGELQDKNQNKKFYDQAVPDVHQCACCYGKLETV